MEEAGFLPSLRSWEATLTGKVKDSLTAPASPAEIEIPEAARSQACRVKQSGILERMLMKTPIFLKQLWGDGLQSLGIATQMVDAFYFGVQASPGNLC